MISCSMKEYTSHRHEIVRISKWRPPLNNIAEHWDSQHLFILFAQKMLLYINTTCNTTSECDIIH